MLAAASDVKSCCKESIESYSCLEDRFMTLKRFNEGDRQRYRVSTQNVTMPSGSYNVWSITPVARDGLKDRLRDRVKATMMKLSLSVRVTQKGSISSETFSYPMHKHIDPTELLGVLNGSKAFAHVRNVLPRFLRVTPGAPPNLRPLSSAALLDQQSVANSFFGAERFSTECVNNDLFLNCKLRNPNVPVVCSSDGVMGAGTGAAAVLVNQVRRGWGWGWWCLCVCVCVCVL